MSKPSLFKVIDAKNRIYSCMTTVYLGTKKLSVEEIQYKIIPYQGYSRNKTIKGKHTRYKIDEDFIKEQVQASIGEKYKIWTNYFRRDGADFPYISRIILQEDLVEVGLATEEQLNQKEMPESVRIMMQMLGALFMKH